MRGRVVFALLLVSCGESRMACDEPLEVDGIRYCVVNGPIVIEGGFDCPPDLPTRVEGPTGVACTDSSTSDPTELPGDACTDIGYEIAMCDPPVIAEPRCSGGVLTFDATAELEYAFCDGFPRDETSGYTFENARRECRRWAGDFPFGVDAAEWRFISAHMSTDFFVGVTDAETEGTWRWVADGTEAEYQPWLESHPLGGRSANFAVGRSDSDWLWADTGVSSTLGFVCRRAR